MIDRRIVRLRDGRFSCNLSSEDLICVSVIGCCMLLCLMQWVNTKIVRYVLCNFARCLFSCFIACSGIRISAATDKSLVFASFGVIPQLMHSSDCATLVPTHVVTFA